MSVTVLIKRIVPKGKEEELIDIYREMRTTALTKKGYIGGETLKRVDAYGQFLVISKWRGTDDWNKWLLSKERQVFQERIDAITSGETKFEIYMH